MKLLLNEIGGDDLRRETFRGDEYLVAPVTLIKSMDLHRGYVPKKHVKKSAPAWNGIPATLNHPRNSRGQLVSANSPNVAEKTWLGYVFNNRPVANGEENKGEIWLDIENARDLGGDAEKVLDELLDGNTVSVSSSYFGDELEPGVYDGEHRDNVRGNLRPDHVAILPNKDGKCSIEDGCGVGAQMANEDSVDTVPPEELQEAAQEALEAREDTGTPGWTRVEQIANGEELTVDDLEALTSDDLVSNADEWAEETLDEFDDTDPLYVAATDESNEDEASDVAVNISVGDKTFEEGLDDVDPDELEQNASSDGVIASIKSLLGFNTMNDKQKFLVNQRGYDEENIPEQGTQCLNRMYKNEQKLQEIEDEQSGNDPTDDDDDDPADDAGVDVNELADELEDRFVTTDDIGDAVADALEANEKKRQKSDLVDDIIGNSDDYDDDDREELMSTPKSVLEGLASNVSTESTRDLGADRRGQFGGSANAGSDDETKSLPSLSASGRKAELEGDD